jgi:hypothetical protein
MNVIQWLARPEATPDFGINLAAGNRDIKGGTAASRKSPHPIRVIAFVRTSYQHFAGA